ncbi:MAG TPA: hypothetical protein VGM78_01900 [Ilumatobacteraceae bacterium]
MEPVFFEQVLDAVAGAIPAELKPFRSTVHRGGLKIWFDEIGREHYESQLIRRDGDLVLEIGFHAEYPKVAANDAVLAHLARSEAAWRRVLGPDPVAGEFLGRATWRRISECWPAPELDDLDAAIEVAARFADYIVTIEEHRRKQG